MTAQEIRANTVLPARRQALSLRTADGLSLVGELALPLERPPVATLVTLHPLPTAGGFMDSHILRKASYRLPASAGIAVLRFNTRGTVSPHGRSDGAFDEARGERLDVEAALAFCAERQLSPRWLLGWSFGADLALMYGLDPAIEGTILLSPPMRYASDADLDRWAASDKSMTVLVPEFDDYLRPAEAAVRFSRVPQADVQAVPGGKHLWVGEKYVQIALNAVVEVLVPGLTPLPTHWDGPMETATVSS
ncbi:MAG TPA: alpha/beta hydrolase [Actinomycetes bacterium]|nr:alpha/beta hydrolase [Actinomycetes bacterium]